MVVYTLNFRGSDVVGGFGDALACQIRAETDRGRIISLLDAWKTFLQELTALELLDQYLVDAAVSFLGGVYRGRNGSVMSGTSE